MKTTETTRVGGGRVLPSWLLERLHTRSSLHVTVKPGTGLNLTSDWWDASIEELGISHCDYGIDTAVSGLAMKISNALDDGVFDDCDPQNAALVLKLYLAKLDGSMWKLLNESAVFAGDGDFEIIT